MLYSWSSNDVLKPASAVMVLYLITAPLTDCYFCISPASHTHKVLSIFSRGHEHYTNLFHTWRAGLNASPDCCHFSWLSESSTNLPKWDWTTVMLIALSNLSLLNTEK